MSDRIEIKLEAIVVFFLAVGILSALAVEVRVRAAVTEVTRELTYAEKRLRQMSRIYACPESGRCEMYREVHVSDATEMILDRLGMELVYTEVRGGDIELRERGHE